jgi:hypothetical protein
MQTVVAPVVTLPLHEPVVDDVTEQPNRDYEIQVEPDPDYNPDWDRWD